MAKKGKSPYHATDIHLKLMLQNPPAKSRIISVRLISMAMTGYFYTFTRPRTRMPMSMIKYDPIGMLRLPSLLVLTPEEDARQAKQTGERLCGCSSRPNRGSC
jgi:large subunit ribosomal protein L33